MILAQDALLRLLASVLWLSNLEFTNDGADKSGESHVVS